MKHLYIILLTAIVFLFNGCIRNRQFDNASGIRYPHSKSVGYSAHDLLSSSKYTLLNVEVQYMTGFEPDATAISHLISMLGNRLNKPGGITVTKKEIPAKGKSTYSVDDLRDIEHTNRTVFTKDNTMGVYFLFVDGGYTTGNVLGVAYNNTSMGLLGKTINDNSGGIGQTSRTTLTSIVLQHEFGHILGLVNIGSDMITNHIDAPNGAHCNNKNCLMYYAVETTDILGFLISGNTPDFDANCLDDLRGNGGK